MAKRYLFAAYLLLVMTTVIGQDNLDRQRADSMIRSLKNKSGTDRVDLLLNIAQYYIFKQGEQQEDFDSAAIYLKESAALTGTHQTSTAYGYHLLTESYFNREKGQSAMGKKKAEEAIRILASGNNRNYLGRAYAELGMYYGSLEDSLQIATRIGLIEKAVAAFDEAGDLFQKAKNLELLGDLYEVFEEHDKAIAALENALVAYDSAKFTETQGVYVLIGATYQGQQEYGQALHNVLKALRIAKKHHVTSMQMCQINYMLGILYRDIDRTDIAIKYFTDGLDVARKNNDWNTICLLTSNVANAYMELQQPEQSLKLLDSLPDNFEEIAGIFEETQVRMNFFKTYVKLHQYDNAKRYYDTLLKVAGNDNLARDPVQSTIYMLLATYHFDKKQYQDARYFLSKSDEVAKESSIENMLIRNLRLWYMLDSAQGNFHSAFNNLHTYKVKMDSVTSERKVRQFQVLNVEYEVGMKEDSMKLKDRDILLLTQKNSLQHANLMQAGFTKNVTVAGIIVAFIIIGLLYRQYRNKQKSNHLITRKNGQLQQYLDEKEWLLKEIHHRVKNNLQLVMSLLNSQSAYIDNEPALTAIHDSQHRVHAMSLIHQKLYNTENLSSIDISAYIRELVSYLADSFNTGQRIRFELSIDPLQTDVSQAVPLGLILNEAITNAIKYAFPGGRSGTISVSLSNTFDNRYLLVISDNGIGMPSGIMQKKQGSLGMSLMEGLSEDLDGHFSIESHKGTTINISFVHVPGNLQPGTLSELLASHN